MSKSCLPVQIIKIVYEHIKPKGRHELQDPQLWGGTRYLYIFPGDDVDEIMRKAWRTHATAEVYVCSHEKALCLSTAEQVKGVWSE